MKICRKNIVVTKEELNFINEILTKTGYELYDEYGFCRDETITKTAKFSDGTEIDVKVVICEGKARPYTEGIHFEKNVTQLSFTEPEEDFLGEWKLFFNNNIYIANVVEEN